MKARVFPAAAPALALAAASMLVAACGGGGTSSPGPSCGSPPPVPLSILFLSYPIPGATNVPDAIGEMVFAGSPNDYFGPTTVTVADAAKNQLPVGAYTAAPSPLPTPYAVPSGFANGPFVAVPVPAFSPATTYTVTYNYLDFGNTPPACRTQNSTTLGSFTTR